MISPITIDEIDDATEEIKVKIANFIENKKITKLPINENTVNLAKRYVKAGILSEKHFEDLLHIAYATLAECDAVISWNRKHLAKQATMQKVNKFNLDNNLRMIIIETPIFILPNGG